MLAEKFLVETRIVCNVYSLVSIEPHKRFQAHSKRFYQGMVVAVKPRLDLTEDLVEIVEEAYPKYTQMYAMLPGTGYFLNLGMLSELVRTNSITVLGTYDPKAIPLEAVEYATDPDAEPIPQEQEEEDLVPNSIFERHGY